MYTQKVQLDQLVTGIFFDDGSFDTFRDAALGLPWTADIPRQLPLPGPETSSDDYAGDTSTSGTVAIGGTTSGSIEVAGDTDWFKITLIAGHSYQFDAKGSPTGNGTLADAFMRLRDSASTSITFNDDNGSTLDSRITYTASSSGTYFLSVGSASASGTGTYRVSAADTTSPPSDDYAGDTSTTGTVAIGGTTSANIEVAGDTDWFKMTLVSGHTYQFDAKGSPTGNGTLADTFLRLRDSAGTSITFNDDNGSTLDSRITYTATSGGTYFLSAGSASASGTGTYKVSAADATPSDDYAGDTSTTGTVAIGGTTSANIEVAGDTDWFKVTLVAGHMYQFDCKGSPTGNGTLADTFLRLRDSAGTSITFNDDNGSTLDSRITYTATSSGTYFLSAGSASASGTGTYKVSATDTTPSDDYAANTSTTGTVAIGGTTSANIEVAGDTDWFKVTLVAGHTYQFDCKGSPTGNGTLADTFLRLRDSAGTSITFNDDNGSTLDSRITYTATSGGTYFLSAGSASASGTGTYKVSAADTTSPGDDYSNNVSTTGVVTVGGSTTGKIETLNDTDWFKVTLIAGHTYRFDAKGADSGNGTLADPFLRLRDGSGNSIKASDDGGTGNDSRFTYTATSSGTYFLSTGAGNHVNGTGTYKIFATDVTTNQPNMIDALYATTVANEAASIPPQYQTVGFYLGRPASTPFGVTHAQEITNSDRSLISIYEKHQTYDNPSYFTVSKADADAAAAIRAALAISQPQGTAIYFAVDMPDAHVSASNVGAYFAELSADFSSLSWWQAHVGPLASANPYAIGIDAGGGALSLVQGEGLSNVLYYWVDRHLGASFASANISRNVNDTSVSGITVPVDTDTTVGSDFGQWNYASSSSTVVASSDPFQHSEQFSSGGSRGPHLVVDSHGHAAADIGGGVFVHFSAHSMCAEFV